MSSVLKVSVSDTFIWAKYLFMCMYQVQLYDCIIIALTGVYEDTQTHANTHTIHYLCLSKETKLAAGTSPVVGALGVLNAFARVATLGIVGFGVAAGNTVQSEEELMYKRLDAIVDEHSM